MFHHNKFLPEAIFAEALWLRPAPSAADCDLFKEMPINQSTFFSRPRMLCGLALGVFERQSGGKEKLHERGADNSHRSIPLTCYDPTTLYNIWTFH